METIRKNTVQRSRLLVWLTVIGIVLAFAGCAAMQKIEVDSQPPGARVLVKNVDEVKKTSETTPSQITIKRNEKDVVILLEKEGYEDAEIALQRKFNWRFVPIGILGNGLFIIQGALKADPEVAVLASLAAWNLLYWPGGFINGNAYKFTPSKINVQMTEATE
ncbi:MAG: hypothetical protein ABIJ00_10540 [Candidatus Eisenbacteria bacterium]